MIQKKIFFLIILSSLFGSSFFAMELKYSACVDNYSGKIAGGPTFAIHGKLLDNLQLSSAIEYKNAHSYKTYVKLLYEKNYFGAGGGLGFYVSPKDVYPTFNISGSILPSKWFKLEVSHSAKINLEGLSAYTESVGNSTFKTYIFIDTADIMLSIDYLKKIQSIDVNETYIGRFEILAHQDTVFLQINAFTEILVFYKNKPSVPQNIEFSSGGGFQIDFGKYGAYFVNGQASWFSLKNKKQPFSISLGVTYQIADSYTNKK
ncbi:MAG TPA: hypothetical protein VFC68_05215, partial [Treponemataceae bacterium]|nr:hypothetical protein [Treponemataceae bacterium]